MSFEILKLGGYGQFVWPAFIFTFVSCTILYVKTKRELQKLEKIFLAEFRYTNAVKTETIKVKKITKEVTVGETI